MILKIVCEEVSGKNLDKFFEQWVYSEGQIELEYKTESIRLENNYLVKISLQQVEEENEAFYFPLEIKMINKDNKEQMFRYEIMSRDTILEISTDAIPDSIELDPNRWLLADIFMKDE